MNTSSPRILIVCSSDHGSTRELVNQIASQHPVKVVLASEIRQGEVYADYDIIGFASGIIFGKCHKSIAKAISKLPSGKGCFYLFTCDNMKDSYSCHTKVLIEAQDCHWLGSFGCLGAFVLDKLLSRLLHKDRKRPTLADRQSAERFYCNLIK